MSLVETVWVGSKATKERVEGVVVLLLVLFRVGHGGYYVDHYHHCCHHHPHQLLRLPPIERSPNYEGSELPKINEDFRYVVFGHLSKGFGTLDYPRRRGTLPQKRWGVGEIPNTQ